MQLKADWLVFGAHPDDAEIGMGGTAARFAAEGKRIIFADLTYAECSSNGDVDSRQAEATRAATVLGIDGRVNLGLPDRGLLFTPDHVNRIARLIREYRPDVVFGPAPTDRHPDHVRTSALVQEALMNARLRKIMPELPSWRVRSYWQYHIHQWLQPQWYIDVSAFYSVKQKALESYVSQFTSPEHAGTADIVSTPINQGFLEQVAARDRLWGTAVNVKYAEAFTTPDPQLIDRF